ncbi:gp436 family protein [Vibrio sp. TRT 21S02]|uniref:gp436 family protein n=1 Tax=Vibrio sp. TRT 21S02 TaxID=3418507 RepID=UPI003CF2F069
MATYATKQDLIDRDEQMLWNFAIDRTTNQLNDTWINQALDQADEEIDSFLGRRFVLPLETVPGILNKVAITIAFYWLGDRDNQVTDLLEKRYEKALTTLKEIASGKRELGLPTIEAPVESSVGKVELVQDNERLFTRNSLKSIL